MKWIAKSNMLLFEQCKKRGYFGDMYHNYFITDALFDCVDLSPLDC